MCYSHSTKPPSEAIVSNDANETPKRGRIDLTQLEEMFSGPWRIEWLDGADADDEEPSAAINAEDYGTIAHTFYRDWDKPYAATTKAMATVPELIAELKSVYAREDMLLDALRIIRDDLDDALKVYPSLQMTEIVAKVRNFANDASQ